jgi:hypothetical protein
VPSEELDGRGNPAATIEDNLDGQDGGLQESELGIMGTTAVDITAKK